MSPSGIFPYKQNSPKRSSIDRLRSLGAVCREWKTVCVYCHDDRGGADRGHVLQHGSGRRLTHDRERPDQAFGKWPHAVSPGYAFGVLVEEG